MTMREKIARGIMLQMGYKRKWEAHGPHVHAFLLRLADAVLDAMDEPTEAMYSGLGGEALKWAPGVWRTMLHAAKAEREG